MERTSVAGPGTAIDDKLQALCELGSQSYPLVNLDSHLNDFRQYAVAHFQPDTFGIFVEDGAELKTLAFFDRHGRTLAPGENLKSYRFAFRQDSFDGYIYVGFDWGKVDAFEKHLHIFTLFKNRVESFLREHYLVRKHQEEMRKMFVSSVQAHARSIEAKDAYTGGHCDRVDRYAELIGRQCRGFNEDWIFNLKVGSILHDIGKIGIRGTILCKPAALDAEESREIQTHPVIGGKIVRNLYGFSLEPMVRHHHERFDGSGYPGRLKADAIPLESRIILIADTFDAMTGDRPYRRAHTTERALDELKRFSGTQFDPELVDVMIAAGDALESARLDLARTRN